MWEWTETHGYMMGEQLGRSGLLSWYTAGGGWAETDPGQVRAGARLKSVAERRWPDLGFVGASRGRETHVDASTPVRPPVGRPRARPMR